MRPEVAPRIEPLDAHHDRAAFSCGEPALDDYIRRQASQDVRRRVAQVMVALGDQPRIVVGYYSISAANFDRQDLPADLGKRLPRYPVPAVILGRLAVDRTHQGRKLGGFLLLDAVDRATRAATFVGIHAIIVDATNDGVIRFYEGFGFRSFPTNPRRLFLPLEAFAKAGL